MNLVCRVYKPTTFLGQLVVFQCFSIDRMMALHFLLVLFVRPTSEEARGAWWCMGTMGTKTFTVGSFGLHPRTRPNGKRNYGGIWWWYVVVINGSASSCCNVFQAAKTDESYDLLHLQCVELLAKVFSKLLQWSSSIISSALRTLRSWFTDRCSNFFEFQSRHLATSVCALQTSFNRVG